MNPLEWYLVGTAIVGSGSYFAGWQGGRAEADRERRRQRNRLARGSVRDTATVRGLVDLPDPDQKPLDTKPDTKYWRPGDEGQPTAEQRMAARAANAKYRSGDVTLPKDGGAS